MQTFLQISWRVRQCKNYENRPTSDEVIVKVKRVAFLKHSVNIPPHVKRVDIPDNFYADSAGPIFPFLRHPGKPITMKSTCRHYALVIVNY